MKTIVSAIGHKEGEEYISKHIHEYNAKIIGLTTHKEGVIPQLKRHSPDFLILRENLPGKIDVVSLIYDIKHSFPETTIIFLAGKRKEGDPLLAQLVNFGIYNIVYGEKADLQEVMGLIKKQKQYQDVSHLQPKPEVVENDKEVYIDKKDERQEDDEEDEAADEEHEEEIEEEEIEEEEIEEDSEEEGSDGKVRLSLPFLKKKNMEDNEGGSNENYKSSKKSFDKNKTIKKIPQKEAVQTIVPTIITVTGVKEGLGASTISYSLANLLGQKYQTAFIELNSRFPFVSYLLDVEFKKPEYMLYGALKKFETTQDVKLANRKDLIDYNEDMLKVYKCLSDNLHFLLAGEDSALNFEKIEQPPVNVLTNVLNHILLQKQFAFVINDCEPYGPLAQEGVNVAGTVVYVVSQDTATIGYSNYYINKLKEKRRVIIVLNQQVNVDSPSLREIESWLNHKIDIVLPYTKGCLKSSYTGIPAESLPQTSRVWKSNLNKLAKIIQRK